MTPFMSVFVALWIEHMSVFVAHFMSVFVAHFMSVFVALFMSVFVVLFMSVFVALFMSVFVAHVSICGERLQRCQVSNLLAYMGRAAGDMLGQAKIGGTWKNMGNTISRKNTFFGISQEIVTPFPKMEILCSSVSCVVCVWGGGAQQQGGKHMSVPSYCLN